MAVADLVTVMRSGRVVWSSSASKLDRHELALAMLGELPEAPFIERAAPGQLLIQLDQASRPSIRGSHPLHGITLDIRHGEVTGIAGVAGNGQRELAMLLLERGAELGQRKQPIRVGYVPEDRATDALALEMSVADNAIVRTFADPPLSANGWLRSDEVAKSADRIIEMFSVFPSDPNRKVGDLSGGNQQRLVLGRELVREPDLVVAHNPTRGLDVNAAASVRRHLLHARNQGAGVVVLSPDLDELIEVADRIAVLYGGRLSAPKPVAQVSTASLARLMSGVE
jgi:simple sugar transport system ATP-binding protein